MSRRGLVVALTFLTLAFPNAVSADRIELANGDVISGTITEMNAQSVSIRTEYGVLTIPREEVVRGVFGEEDVALLGSIAPDAIVLDAADQATLADQSGSSDGGLDREDDLPAPLLHFPLDGHLEDIAGSYELVNNGLQFAPDQSGASTRALRSLGTGTYLSVASDATLDALSNFTVTLDVRLDQLAGTSYLVSKWGRSQGETAEGKFTLQTKDGGLTVFLVGPDNRYYSMRAPRVLEAQSWHSVAVRFAEGIGSIHVDGEVVASRTFPITTLSLDDSPLLVMTAEATTDDRFTLYNAAGMVDDIRLYATGLSDPEIRRIANRDA